MTENCLRKSFSINGIAFIILDFKISCKWKVLIANILKKTKSIDLCLPKAEGKIGSNTSIRPKVVPLQKHQQDLWGQSQLGSTLGSRICRLQSCSHTAHKEPAE